MVTSPLTSAQAVRSGAHIHQCTSPYMLLIHLFLRFCFILIFTSERVHGDICELSDDLTGCYKKFLSYEAIGHIHKYLDNDKNGEVDPSEAAKFVREKFSGTEQGGKSQLLTSEDPLISLPDLWLMWKRNPAFNWTVKQTIQWLSESVDLPQYSDMFVRHSVDGKSLPLLALQNMSYLTNVLLIQNPIDKRKIMLKALDTILFGPPRKSFVLLSTKASFITASCGLGVILALMFFHGPFHRTSSNAPGDSSDTERNLKQLQMRLDDLERLRRVVTSWENNSETNSKWCTPLSTKQVTQPDLIVAFPSKPVFSNPDDGDDGDSCGSHSEGILFRGSNEPDLLYSRSSLQGELTLWLQLTYELELQHHREKKAEAEAQLNAARYACKRLNRKRYNILGSVRLLHTDSLDELEDRLMHSKRVLEQLQSELQERARRWNRIEYLMGIQIRSNPGLSQLLALLGRSGQSAEPSSGGSSYPSPMGIIIPTVGSCYQSTADSFHTFGEDVASTDQAALTSRSCQDGRLQEVKSVGLARNYSFVRPFANLWRRKAKCSKAAGK